MRTEAPVDVLVIGGACAALCAAIAARRRGASVRLLERAPVAMRGGNTRHARNFRIMHVGPAWGVPDSYDEAEFLADLMRVTAGATDERLARLVIRGSADIVPWLAANGVHMQDATRGVLPYSRRTAFLFGGGKAMMNSLYATARTLGVVITYGAEVTGIGRDAQAACRADVLIGERRERVTARAIVVAAGGQAADLEQLRIDFGERAEHMAIRGTPYADGRLMRSLIASGVREIGDRASGHIVAVDARGPRFDGGIVTRITAIPYGIVVDRNGRRLDGERADLSKTHYARWGPRIADAPGQIAYLVMDDEARRRAPVTAIAPIEAPSLTELASKLEIDPAAFAATVTEASTAAISRAKALATPPFFAWPLRPGLTFTHHGIAVDDRMRVLTTDGRALGAVFAAGTIMSANLLGRGYLAGLGVTLAAVSGRIAGEEAARRAAA